MRFVFLGTPRFGALVLKKLVEQGLLPIAIVTNPDRPTGRKQELTPPPVKQTALELGLTTIPLLQPEKFSDAYETLRLFDADCFVVAAYGKILRTEALQIPHRGVLGVHPSLLPTYRGSSPMQQALLDGVTETGVSIFVVDEEIDHGPVLLQKTYTLAEEETYLTLEEKLAALGGVLLNECLEPWIDEDLSPKKQNHDDATFTNKFTTDDGYIPYSDLEKAARGDMALAEACIRKISALNPEPGIWTEKNGDRIKLLEAKIIERQLVISAHQKAGKKAQHEQLEI